MPTEVMYRNLTNRNSFSTNLNFDVVNNPQPDVYFEDLRPIEFDTTKITNTDATRQTYDFVNINLPDFRVIRSKNLDGLSSVQYDNVGLVQINAQTYDATKATPFIDFSIQNGLSVSYCARFSITTAGTANVKYTFANSHTIDLQNTMNDNDVMLYDNIPVSVNFVSPGRSYDNIPVFEYNSSGVATIIYMPYKHEDRFDMQKMIDGNTAYKFDYLTLAANETKDTKVFSDATYSLLHVVTGTCTINGYTLEQDQFYEHDATQSIDIVAGESGVNVIHSIKVPSFSL